MTNLKDTVSTICGIVAAIALPLSLAGDKIGFPLWLTILFGTIGSIAGGIIGVLTGRNADGTKTVGPPETPPQS